MIYWKKMEQKQYYGCEAGVHCCRQTVDTIKLCISSLQVAKILDLLLEALVSIEIHEDS